MFSSERSEVRKVFFDAWQKHLTQHPIEPLEADIISVMLLHPEYHSFLSAPERYQDKDFAEGNPFLHMGLHIALREQIKTHRPLGITDIYKRLTLKLSDEHAAEHAMIECLATFLWEAQQSNTPPDEKKYLDKLNHLL
jgi:hypothetical protein